VIREIYYTPPPKAIYENRAFLLFFLKYWTNKPNNQANFIFLPADPLQSFHNNWILMVTHPGKKKARKFV